MQTGDDTARSAQHSRRTQRRFFVHGSSTARMRRTETGSACLHSVPFVPPRADRGSIANRNRIAGECGGPPRPP